MRILKWLLGSIGILLISLFIFMKIISDPLPQGTVGEEADALANKILKAINKSAWDTTGVIQMDFSRGTSFFMG